MSKSKFLLFTLLLLLFTSVTKLVRAQDYMIVPGIIHIHSNFSIGVHSPNTLSGLAQKKNIQVVIVTDLALIRCEYGLFPLRRLIKRTFRKDCIFSCGVKKYLKEIARANESRSKVLLIPGAEVAPFYYWMGSYFKKDLTMHNWHKQFLVIGLNKARDYKGLPMVSNPHYSRGSIGRLWPLIPFLFGIWLIRKKRCIWGIIIITLGGLFLANNFPFKTTRYDQYHGDQGEAPYQRLIDYVNGKEGLVFWSVPQAPTSIVKGGVKSYTAPFLESLVKTHNYTGFGIFYAEYEVPGEIWDRILAEYCDGKRERPVWVIGEVIYSYTRPTRRMNRVQTVFLLPRLTQEAVLHALKKGRMYAFKMRQNERLSLDSFLIRNSNDKEAALMGGELRCSLHPGIEIRVSSPDPEVKRIEIKLIREGKVIKVFGTNNPAHILYEDDYCNPGKKTYYRLDITTNRGSRIISNPIFVKFEPQTFLKPLGVNKEKGETGKRGNLF